MDKLYNRYELISRFQFVVNNRMRKDSSQQQEVGTVTKSFIDSSNSTIMTPLLETDMFFEKMSNMPATLTKMSLSCGDHVSSPVAAEPTLQLNFI